MYKPGAGKLEEFMSFHPSSNSSAPSNSPNDSHERVDELIAFFYDLIRDEPSVLAKIDLAMRERYGYGQPLCKPSTK